MCLTVTKSNCQIELPFYGRVRSTSRWQKWRHAGHCKGDSFSSKTFGMMEHFTPTAVATTGPMTPKLGSNGNQQVGGSHMNWGVWFRQQLQWTCRRRLHSVEHSALQERISRAAVLGELLPHFSSNDTCSTDCALGQPLHAPMMENTRSSAETGQPF